MAASFAAVCLLIFIPVKVREWGLILVWGWVGAFCLGYMRQNIFFSAFSIAAYQALSMTVPRYFFGSWPVKAEMGVLETACRMFIAACILNLLLWSLGKLLRCITDKRKQASPQ